MCLNMSKTFLDGQSGNNLLQKPCAGFGGCLETPCFTPDLESCRLSSCMFSFDYCHAQCVLARVNSEIRNDISTSSWLKRVRIEYNVYTNILAGLGLSNIANA